MSAYKFITQKDQLSRCRPSIHFKPFSMIKSHSPKNWTKFPRISIRPFPTLPLAAPRKYNTRTNMPASAPPSRERERLKLKYPQLSYRSVDRWKNGKPRVSLTHHLAASGTDLETAAEVVHGSPSRRSAAKVKQRSSRRRTQGLTSLGDSGPRRQEETASIRRARVTEPNVTADGE